MRREWQRVTDLGPARPGRMYATLEFLKGARVGGSRRTNGSLVVERHRFATWPDFEYEVEYDTDGPGWMLNRAEFVRLSGSMPPDAPPAPWRCLKNEALAGFEVLREIDSWGSYDSYEVRDADGARLFLSFSHGLLLEVAPLESLPGQPADHGQDEARRQQP
ncbi:hypothetical protein AB0F11_27465 [Streptomyces sp. NPDC032472]|uniref:hypothetical protein n=1 Tax=Streptomyces sp. NPDC032472 TaxID=3155018 RepID=UPI0033F8D9AE